jgi:endoglucanase
VGGHEDGLSGDGIKTYYLLIKSGALSGGNLDISFDKISITHNVSHAEAVTNSNFGSSTGWSELAIASSLSLNYNDSTLAKVPTNSAGSVLRITRPAGVSDYINGAIYQAITLEGGQRYTLSGVFKDNGSSNAWAEIYLLSQAPVNGVDVIDTTTKVDFTTAPISEIEDLFKSYSTVEYDVHSGLQHWLTTSDQLNLFN